jgi:hypothetical protein
MPGVVSSAQCTAKLDGRPAGRESGTTGIASAVSSPDSYAMNSHYDIPKTVGDAAAAPSATEGREALRILRSLADGKHPFTGEPLPDESCYQSAKVLRALLAGIEALEKATERKSRKIARRSGQALGHGGRPRLGGRLRGRRGHCRPGAKSPAHGRRDPLSLDEAWQTPAAGRWPLVQIFRASLCFPDQSCSCSSSCSNGAARPAVLSWTRYCLGSKCMSILVSIATMRINISLLACDAICVICG